MATTNWMTMKAAALLATPGSSKARSGDNNNRCIVCLSLFDGNSFAIVRHCANRVLKVKRLITIFQLSADDPQSRRSCLCSAMRRMNTEWVIKIPQVSFSFTNAVPAAFFRLQ
jgi:hypothetical protein